MSAPPDPSSNYVAAAHFEHVEAGRHAGVVLLHGLGGDLSQPRDYTGAVIDGRPASRLLADARLHGLTQIAEPGAVTFDVLAADIEALAEAVGLPSERVLVGVSMGAGTALRLALRSQAGIRGLVLIRPAWLHEPFPANLEPFGVIAELITEHGPVEGKRKFAELPLCQAFRTESPSMAASLLEQFDKPWAPERVRRLIDIPGSTPFRDPEELSAIAIPTLIIGAPQDPVHPLSIAHQWAEWIPTAQYIQITARDAPADRHRSDLRSAVDSFCADL